MGSECCRHYRGVTRAQANEASAPDEYASRLSAESFSLTKLFLRVRRDVNMSECRRPSEAANLHHPEEATPASIKGVPRVASYSFALLLYAIEGLSNCLTF